mgnify:CR=1 FL=1
MHKDGTLSPLLSKLYFPPTRPMFELYDLVNDPYELNNLAGQPDSKAIEADLKQAMHEWMITERDYLPLPIASGGPNKKKAKEKAAAAAAAASAEKEE